MELRRKLLLAFLLLSLVLVGGTTGYKILSPNSSLVDCIYMTVITLTTVGYAEVLADAAKPALRIFTMILIFSGVGVLLYVISATTAFIIEGELLNSFWRRRMEKRIEALRDHFIVCGDDETVEHIIAELAKTHRPFVLIESSAKGIERLRKTPNVCLLEGDPHDDEVLHRAGILHARGIISAFTADKDNLMVVVTARHLNPQIRIVTREVDPRAAPKFLKAGANAVISPNFIGGLRMVSEMIRPTVVGFLDRMLRDTKGTLRVEEVTISDRSSWKLKKLADIPFKKELDLLVLALKLPTDEDLIYNPDEAQVLNPGATLIVMGDVTHIQKARSIAEGPSA